MMEVPSFMRCYSALGLLLMSIVAGAAHAQETTPPLSRLSLAEQVFDASDPGKEALYGGLRKVMKGIIKFPECVNEERRKIMAQSVVDKYDFYRAYRSTYIQQYHEIFSSEELQAMLDFYTSEAGKKMLKYQFEMQQAVEMAGYQHLRVNAEHIKKDIETYLGHYMAKGICEADGSIPAGKVISPEGPNVTTDNGKDETDE